MKLPTLYKKTEKGAIRTWRAWSEGDQVFTEYGNENGSLQRSQDTAKAKNVGRANATTPEEQAALEAEQLHRKKVKEGYTESRELASSEAKILAGPEAMLAYKLEDVKPRQLIWPAAVQPKLDGIRCLAEVKDGVCTLWTRSHKKITTVPHINKAVEIFCEEIKLDLTLDGELYASKLKEDFGKILSVINRDEQHADSSVIEYHCYDIVDNTLTFVVRHDCLHKYCRRVLSKYSLPIKEVETFEVKDRAALDAYLEKCLERKFEGAMLRALNSLYEGKRSRGLLKYKVMSDSEFEVIDTQEGAGRMQQLIGSFICKTESGVKFRAKLEGETSKIPKFSDSQKYIGKILTCRYQGLSKDGVPRFPVAVRFKNEIEG